MTRRPVSSPSSRILWIIKSLSQGGAENLLVSLARALCGDTFQVTVAYCGISSPEVIEALKASNVTCHSLQGRFPFGWIGRLWFFLRTQDFDVVHVHSPLPGSFARMFLTLGRRRHSVTLITTEHNSWSAFHPVTRVLNAITIRGDDAVLAVSEDALASMSPSVRRRARRVQHGIDFDDARRRASDTLDIRKQLGIPESVSLISCVSNLRPEKDHETLLAGLQLLLETESNFACLIIGSGPTQDRIAAEIVRRNLTRHVIMLGQRSDALAIMKQSDVAVLSSRIEGFPVVIMEAVALGIPIVATSVGGIPDQLTHRLDALLVPPSDPAALAAELHLVLNDADLRERLVENSARLRTSLDVASSAECYRRIYQHADREA